MNFYSSKSNHPTGKPWKTMGNSSVNFWDILLQRKWLGMSVRQFDQELPKLFEEFLHDKPNFEEIECWFCAIPHQYWTSSNSSPFHIAAYQSNHRIIEYLFTNGYDGINNVDFINKVTPLGISIARTNGQVTKSLLEAGAYPRIGLLQFAIMTEQFHVAELLVRAGADVNAVSERHFNSLHLLVFTEKSKHQGELRKDATRLLIEAGIDINKINNYGDCPLHLAISNDYIEIAHLLLDAGADFNVKNEQSQTPLHLAIRMQKVELAERLIRMDGIDLNAEDIERRTPLCYAIEANSTDLCKMLVERGASTDFTKIEYFYPLHRAVKMDNLELVNFLMSLETGIDLLDMRQDLDTRKGLTCLHMAALFIRENLFFKLLEHGADISAKSDDGFSVFYYASIALPRITSTFDNQHQRFMRKLISRGTKMNLKPCDELVFLDYVTQSSDEETLRLFISNCGFQMSDYSPTNYYKLLCDVAEHKFVRKLLRNYIQRTDFHLNTKDEFGRGVVHYAALMQNVVCLKYLLKLKADIDSVDVRNGDTPLHVAVKHGNVECVKLLLFHNLNNNFAKLQKNLPVDLAIVFHVCGIDRSIIMDYIIKFIAIKEVIDNKSMDQSKIFFLNEKFQRLLDLCKNELRIMQTSMIYDSVSFFHVLVNTKHYARNKYVIRAFENYDVANDFSVYGCILVDQFEKVRKRPLLIQQAESGLSRILQCNSASFAVIFDNIFKYVPNRDLRTLRLV